MERYTAKEHGGVAVPPDRLQEALERLAAFEDMVEQLAREQESIPKQLEELRGRGKEKTVQFKELMAQKLVNGHMVQLLQRYRILPADLFLRGKL